MKTYRHLALFVALALIHTLAHASCEESEVSLPVMFNDAKAVFIGTAVEGMPFGQTDHYDRWKRRLLSEANEDKTSKNVHWQLERLERESSLLSGKVRFIVDQVFKGDLGNQVTVDVGSFPRPMMIGCVIHNIELDHRYIVFADGEDNNLRTACETISLDVDYSKELLAFLKNLPPFGSGGTLQGKIWKWKNDDYVPLPGVTFHISSKDTPPITLKTGPDGAFEIKHLLPGHYRVEPELRRFPGYHVDDEEEVKEVDLDDRGAAEVHFKLSLADESSKGSAAPEVP
jgi:hypothetical protein